ncbi:MAG TPA: S8 family serine peptidase [Coleofasciculaceae cyanobacterium]
MLDHSNQLGIPNGLPANPLSNRFSSLDLPSSHLLSHQQRHPVSGSVLPAIFTSEKQLPVLTAQPIRTANLNLSKIFPDDRHFQVHSGKEVYPERLTGKITAAQLVGNSKSQSGVQAKDGLLTIPLQLNDRGFWPRPLRFSQTHPLVGIIDTGFSATDPQVAHASLKLGRDRIDNDANPLITAGDQHGTLVLDAIAAKDGNAPLWLGRAVGSGQWAESLVEFVDAAKTSGHSRAIVNLSFDLTQVNSDGSISTRQQLTPQEWTALSYARQNGVLIVAAAGNTGSEMSALGQASQEFDNLITVGAAQGLDRAPYSSYGKGLTLLANGSFPENTQRTEEGTSIATAEVTGAVSQVWTANPKLGYRQVIDILKTTATDLKSPGQDIETGSGLLNLTKALYLATQTIPVLDAPMATVPSIFISQKSDHTSLERPAFLGVHIPIVDDAVDATVGVAKGIGNGAVTVVNAGVDVAKDAGNGIVSIAQDIGNGAVGVVKGVGNGGINIFHNIVNGTIHAITDATNGAIQTVTGAAQGVVQTVTDISQGHFGDAAGDLIGTAFDLGNNVINTASQVAGNGIQTAGNVAGTAIQTAGNVAGTAVHTAGNVAGDAIHTVGSMTGDIVATVDPNAGAAVKAIADQGAAVTGGVGDGINTGIHLGADVAEKVVTEKITGILERGVYQVQAFPDRLKRLGQDLTKNPTKGFKKWIGQVGMDLAETLGIPEDAETIADLLKPETRALTPREIKLAKSVFGNSINYRLVRLDEAAKTVDWAKQIKGFNSPRPFTTFHTINSWGSLKDETLIHELTHVWQYEHGGAKYIPEALAVNGNKSGYDYKGVSNLRKLQATGKGMSSFDPEKQAKIVEEYFLIKTGQASKAEFSGGATSKDLPTYAHFVKEVSTLSEKNLD